MSPRPQQPGWIPYAGFLLAVAGIVYTSGQLTGDVRNNTERIAKLEIVAEQNSSLTGDMRERMARIEEKLDRAINDKRGDGR